jgi:miniconductance mechanosensitive channel
MLVRQLEPTERGLPLQVYAFTDTTEWAAYEAIQADIFDHLISVAPEFGLRIFQQPTGSDFKKWGEAQYSD